jgi:membrane protein HdeD
MSIPASRPLRWLAAALVLAAAALALALPFISATLLTIAIGGVAIASGVSQLIRLSAAGDLLSRLFRGLSGLLYLAGGVWILVDPVISEVSLTLFVGLLLAVEGLMELATAAAADLPAKGLVLLDGLVTAGLGVLLIAEWPSDSLWAVGTLLGIALVFSAVNLLMAPLNSGD